MDKIQVSVIMPLYNKERYVSKAVESVLSQTMGDLELIIVDDCSTDQSLRVVKSFADSRVRIFQNNKNLGVSASMNRGIREAQSDKIALIGADDVYASTKLEEQLKCYNPSNLVYTGFYWLTENDKSLSTDVHMVPQDPAKDFARGSSIAFASMMFSRKAAESFGVFDESLSYGEDFDFALKMCEKGIKFIGIPKPLYGYRHVHDSLSMKHTGKPQRIMYELIMKHKRIAHIEDPQVKMYLAILIVSARNYLEALKWIIRDPVIIEKFYKIILPAIPRYFESKMMAK